MENGVKRDLSNPANSNKSNIMVYPPGAVPPHQHKNLTQVEISPNESQDEGLFMPDSRPESSNRLGQPGTQLSDSGIQ